MKRENNVMKRIITHKNIQRAIKKAMENATSHKKKQEIREFKKNEEENIEKLINDLKTGKFTSSEYRFYTIQDKGKEREIADLPFYPDRIAHWAIMLVAQPRFEKVYIHNTYAAIKERGVDLALKKLNRDLKQHPDLKYCLKIDVEKFFPNVDKEILMAMFRKIFKDKEFLNLLDQIVDEYPKSGIPIGNYTSQIFGNFYLSYFDHWIKEEKRVQVYHRYMDDMIFLAQTKEELWELFEEIEDYLSTVLNLKVKGNYQVFPISVRGVDFVGYKSYGYKITMRNENRQTFFKIIKRHYKYKEVFQEDFNYNSTRRGKVSAYYGISKRSTGALSNIAKEIIEHEREGG